MEIIKFRFIWCQLDVYLFDMTTPKSHCVKCQSLTDRLGVRESPFDKMKGRSYTFSKPFVQYLSVLLHMKRKFFFFME